MKQLVYVLNSNKDVIVSIQAGFIGKYGEWYYTGSSEFGDGNYTVLTNTQWSNRKEIIDYMLLNFPQEIPIQLRYVYAKQRMYGNTFDDIIGFYNDSFLGTYGDSGTFVVSGAQTLPSTTDITYWQNNTFYNPVSGETNMLNAPRTDCANALLEMDRYNWSLINKDYFPQIITNWQTVGCFTTMQKNIGYNFRLNNANITNGILTINIGNYGYANLFKTRRALIVCKNTTTNVNYSYVLNTNIKTINTASYNMSMNISTLGLPVGVYKIFLNLPDPILTTNPKYSIRCSNINTWTTEGFNDLLLTWTVNALTVVNKIVQVQNEQVTAVKIYNFNGTLVSTDPDTSDLPEGLYIVVAKTASNRTVTKKLQL
jgi:hypothetical protein